MIVQCPECQTRYNLPDEKVRPEGSKVRCSRCKHVFAVNPPAPEDFDDLFGAPSGQGAEPHDFAPPPPGEEDSFAAALDRQPPLPGFEAGSRNAFPTGEGSTAAAAALGLGLDDVPPPPVKRSSGATILIALLVALLLLLGGATLAYFQGWLPPALLDKVAAIGLPLPGVKPVAQPPAPAAKPEANISQITLENVRQYMVQNDKTGNFIVIEGKAINTFPSPKEMIRVEVSLFDKAGTSLVSKSVLGGNILSFFQLQILSRTEIEAALAAESGVLANNTHLATGQGVPFMVTFFDPPAGVAEFGVNVVEAKDPPKQ